MERGFSDHIVYVDESGDHGPTSPEFPIFVLAFCLFEKMSYAEDVTTAVQKLKFKYFGHDSVVLHEREIRKAKAPFEFLQRKTLREKFMTDVAAIISELPVQIIAAAIRKDRLREQYRFPDNPYHLALQFGVERISRELRMDATSPLLHVVVESRGTKEDNDLELEFRRLCEDGDGGEQLPMRVKFASKKGAHAGLEIADLIARPIARHLLDPDQPNRAYQQIERKLRRSPAGKIEGWGLKCFP